MKHTSIILKKILLGFFLFSYCISNSQNDTLSLLIKDSITGAGIPYAHFFSKEQNSGVISDKNGMLILIVSNDSLEKNFIISCLGYQTAFLSSSKFLKTKRDTTIIVMKAIAYELSEIVINSNQDKRKYKTVSVGFNKRSKANFGSFYNKVGSETALYFPNTKSNKGYITSVRYFIKESNFYDTPFRVRIYNVDTLGKPQNDILKANLIIYSEKGNSWIEVDLSKYYIEIPDNGFFVAMEWLPLSKDYVYAVKWKNIERNFNGQILGAVSQSSKKPRLTWQRALNKDWKQRLPPPNINAYNQINAAIGATIKAIK